jgi:hypothetical protein
VLFSLATKETKHAERGWETSINNDKAFSDLQVG